jgi:hypothetical protein
MQATIPEEAKERRAWPFWSRLAQALSDPMVLAHARALLNGGEAVAAMWGGVAVKR